MPVLCPFASIQRTSISELAVFCNVCQNHMQQTVVVTATGCGVTNLSVPSGLSLYHLLDGEEWLPDSQ